MNNQFDWHLIRAFLAALDAGSLLGAAKKLQTTQPTVGRQVAQLEAQMGVVLFERTGRGLQPTATALSLADAARSMESGALQLARQLQAKQTQVQGTVRITASQPVAYQLLPPILSSMRDALPEIQVELISSNQVSNLLRREADIAVRMVQPDQGTLIAKKLGSVSVGVYAHKSYLARFGTPHAPDDLLNHRSDRYRCRGPAHPGRRPGLPARTGKSRCAARPGYPYRQRNSRPGQSMCRRIYPERRPFGGAPASRRAVG